MSNLLNKDISKYRSHYAFTDYYIKSLLPSYLFRLTSLNTNNLFIPISQVYLNEEPNIIYINFK